MATHSSILAWRILWTEEPGGQRNLVDRGTSCGVAKSQTQLSDLSNVTSNAAVPC